MTRTTVRIDNRALAEAARLLGTKTKKATVDAALREVVRSHRRPDELDPPVAGKPD